jgi:hypothetical protein
MTTTRQLLYSTGYFTCFGCCNGFSNVEILCHDKAIEYFNEYDSMCLIHSEKVLRIDKY